jgi:hypothetical protein
VRRAARAFAPLCAALVLAGCGSEPPPKKGVTQAGVVTFATFARVLDDEKHIAEGLDIDGRVHPDGDSGSCGMKDYTSPEGEPGIDNQFGGLLPVIEAKVGTENLGQLLATAIANGQLLILIAIDDLDSAEDDPAVSVRLAAGLGTPLLDAQGKFITYQTFGVDHEAAPVSTLKGRVAKGVLRIDPGEAVLPVRVLDANFNIELHGMKGEITLTPDAAGSGLGMQGTIGGGIAVADFKDIIKQLNIGSDVINSAITLVGLVADLARDDDQGGCQQVSAALKIETAPAFILDHGG